MVAVTAVGTNRRVCRMRCERADCVLKFEIGNCGGGYRGLALMLLYLALMGHLIKEYLAKPVSGRVDDLEILRSLESSTVRYGS